jgi:hypothetical protein
MPRVTETKTNTVPTGAARSYAKSEALYAEAQRYLAGDGELGLGEERVAAAGIRHTPDPAAH